MIVKRYSPARVQDPTSQQHMVHVKPGQEIVLSLSKDLYENPEAQISSRFLTCEEMAVDVGRWIYRFKHSPDIHEWSEYSNVFLGEIWIDSAKSISKLGVILDTTTPEKSDHIAVVNPDCIDLRVRPHCVIETIVYDLDFTYQDEWHCDWTPSIEGLGMGQLGYDSLCLRSWKNYWNCALDDPIYRYARYPRVDPPAGTWPKQHHFWFRFCGDIEEICNNLSSIEHAGKITVTGRSNRFMTNSAKRHFVIDLFLDCRKNNRALLQNTLSLSPKNETSPYVLNKTNKTKTKPPKPKKPKVPVVMDIEVEAAERTFERCRTVSSRMAHRQVESACEHDPYDGYDCDDYHEYYPMAFHNRHWDRRWK